jgi:hypothetical protein
MAHLKPASSLIIAVHLPWTSVMVGSFRIHTHRDGLTPSVGDQDTLT